jgi:Ca2+-binding EF-hand superfamily protein
MNSVLKEKIEIYIKEIFNRYDVNHDDCLDKSELKHLLEDCLGQF